MITCKLCGGLGNQLFQIFTVISYALSYSKPFFFLNNYQLGTGEHGETIRFTYWHSFLKILTPFLKNLHELPRLMYIKQNNFRYEKLPENLDNNHATVLVGYFQSPLFFHKHRNIICKLLKLDTKKFIVNSKANIDFINEPHISMHFRLGDYKVNSHVYPILTQTYYRDSISYILEETTNKPKKVLYFCEDNDVFDVEKTINYLREKFPSLEFSRANPLLEDWEQMLLMSLCQYNIIANSTFSWWGAYLNDNVNRIVCYPEQWFQPTIENDTSDLFPEDWQCISCK